MKEGNGDCLKMKIKYEISNFMTLDEFEEYIRINVEHNIKEGDKESWKKYFLLIIKNGMLDELIPCNIYTYKDLQLRPIEDRESDYPNIYSINEMKHTMQYKKDENIEYYIALEENEKVINVE